MTVVLVGPGRVCADGLGEDLFSGEDSGEHLPSVPLVEVASVWLMCVRPVGVYEGPESGNRSV